MSEYSSNGKIRRNQKNRERAIEQRLSLNEFTTRARAIHNNYYDYSKVNYVTSREKVEIICPEHGSFWQTPSAHLQGQRCPKCAKFLSSIRRQNLHSVEEFLSASDHENIEIVENSIPDYWNNKKILAKCKFHGIFEVVPGFHLRHRFGGCVECGKISRAENNQRRNKDSITKTSEFIKRANVIHDGKYKYDLTLIRNGLRDKVTINCPIHGTFAQKAGDHLNGNGCQKCANFSTSIMEQEWLRSLNVREEYWQSWIKLKNKRIKVDAHDPKTNTIYEFFGDFWHGNPDKYPPDDINPRNKKYYGDLYKSTMNRIKLIKEHGYSLVFVWESDYKKGIK